MGEKFNFELLGAIILHNRKSNAIGSTSLERIYWFHRMCFPCRSWNRGVFKFYQMVFTGFKFCLTVMHITKQLNYDTIQKKLKYDCLIRFWEVITINYSGIST